MIASILLSALAQDPDPRGLPIAEVVLSAPRGGLPEESLEALLRARQLVPYDPQLVRADLVTLFRVGDFSAVEADLQPWFTTTADGDTAPAVLLTYRVLPAPRAERIRVQGNRGVATKRVLDAAALTPGQVFYPELEAVAASGRVAEWYRRQGYVNAAVEVDAIPTGPDRYEVWIRVFEGRPNVLDQTIFAGNVPPSVGERTLTRWARTAGVRENRPISQEAIGEAQYELRSRLARVTGGLFRPRRGWIGARVTPAVQREEDGRVTLTWAIEPGPRLALDVRGLRWRPAKKARDALGVDERLRLTRGFVDEAPGRMEAFLQQRGFYAAKSRVELQEPASDGEGTRQVLRVEVERGARHGLRGQPPRASLRYVGNASVPAAELTRVADQASPEVIRLDYFTMPDLEAGMAAMRNLYRGRGHEAARVTLDDVTIRPLGNAFTRPFVALGAALLGNPAPKRIIPTIRIEEGPITTQRLAGIAGPAPEVSVTDLEDRLRALSGEPFDPGAAERVARQVAERHREAGYLQVDARVRHEPVGDGSVDTIVDVEPGPLVLLRSVVTRGPRDTRPGFIRREVELERGAPLSSSSLEEARRRLYDLGIFSAVGTQLLGDEAARDLLITVTERKRWAAEAGAGVNTDQGARVFGRLTRRNLFGVAHRLDAYGLVGVTYASDSVADWAPDLRNLEWRAAFSYTAPHFPVRAQDVVVDVLLQERRQERTWRMARTGTGITLDTAFDRRTSLQAVARAELRNLQEVDSRALLAGEPWKVLAEDADRAATSWCHPCRMAESLQAVLLHDLRDDPVQPRSGLLFTAVGELSPGLPWQPPELRSAFAKAELRLSGFLPVGEHVLLRLSGEGGHARSLSGGVLPLEDRFRLGGTGSLRGFARQSVGPRNKADRVAVDWPDGIGPIVDQTERDDRTRWIPTGGDTSGLAVAELIVPFPALGLASWDGYAGALFADVGNVWLLGEGEATSDGLAETPLVRVGVGVGARVDTPIGPLQLDLATNPEAAFAQGARRALLVEGWEEPVLRAHISLGTLW